MKKDMKKEVWKFKNGSSIFKDGPKSFASSDETFQVEESGDKECQ